MSILFPRALLLLCLGAVACAGDDRGGSLASGGAGLGGGSSGGGGGDPCAGRCGQFEICVDEQCVCQPERELCAGSCVDLASDPANCGACGSSCAASAVCSLGSCTDSCAPGLVDCGAACVTLATDPAHCGACDRSCGPGESCLFGQCQPRTETGSGGTGGVGAGGGDPGGSASGGAEGIDPSDLVVTAVPGHRTVGLEWPPVEGATSYNVYFSTSPGVTTTSGQRVADAPRGFVHRGLTDGQTMHYVVTAVTAAGESAPSPEIAATPTGEWVLEELGTGDFVDVRTGAPVPTVPIEARVHVLLFAEGYTVDTLDQLHDDALHDGDRTSDVDRWIDEVFAIEPYALLREAFVVWYLPRASNTDIRAAVPDTAFSVPIDTSSSFAMMQSVLNATEVAARSWAAIELHPYRPTDFSGPMYRRARTAIASFLIYDPNQGRASVSGLATSLQNPANTQESIATAFGVGHAHEFTHAFSGLRDEYLENDNSAPTSWSGTSNVVGTNVCSELPWAHLLPGTSINPSTEGLVGAFGTAARGYHAELLCLMNGTHDNGEYYARGDSGACTASSCTLRTNGRMCNFCRETTALRVYQRTSVLGADDAGFEAWVATCRDPFYARFGFQVPALVPQSNDVNRPERGTPLFEDCAR